MRPKWASRAMCLRLALAGLILLALCPIMLHMPGKSFRGALPPLSDDQRQLAETLERDVRRLAGEIGERNVFRRPALDQAAAFVASSLVEAGYTAQRQAFDTRGVACANVWADLPGTSTPERILVIGAHYDSVHGCPGANDNATGVAAVLALARRFRDQPRACTLRFVAFVNEEPPFFQTDRMGSLVFARWSREQGHDIRAMLCLETIGYYTDEPESQHYPPPFNLFYPSTGNFIGFISRLRDTALVRRCVGTFRSSTDFPCEGAAVPGFVTGVGWSDHWSFWQAGYPAVMITDTAPFRYRYYHTPGDTPEKVDYERMARVVEGVAGVVEALAGNDTQNVTRGE